MYIAPDTEIRVLKNVPLDNTYEHTIVWTERTQQTDYFKSKTKFTFSKQTYQRLQRGKMRVEKPAESLYDCNYLMYQNTAFGTKWFYAFITGVEYVNNITSEITFEIDPLNTWYFDWSFGDCFVEREHSRTDNPGDNIVAEPIDVGDYVFETSLGNSLSGIVFSDWVIVVAIGLEDNAGSVVLNVPYGGDLLGMGPLYSQLNFKTFDANAQGVVNCYTYLSGLSLLSREDAIVDIFMCPRDIITENTQPGVGDTYSEKYQWDKPYTSLGGYVPKNKKLFTHPYCFLRLDNQQGHTEDYKYEYFYGNKCRFAADANLSINPKVLFSPCGYADNDVGNEFQANNFRNIQFSIDRSDFPKCPYVTSDFGAKLMQSTIGFALSAGRAFTSSEKAAEKFADASPFSAVGSMLSSLATTRLSSSNVNSSDVMFSTGLYGVNFYHAYVRPEFARIIDDFFSKFGYQTNRLKKPNWNSRPHWNYVKTKNCVIVGSIPGDDMNKICKIHDAGITYWKNPDEVGNYNLDNSPT